MSTLRRSAPALLSFCALAAPASASAAIGPVTVSPTTNNGPSGGGQTAIITVPGASGQVPVFFGSRPATILTELPVTLAGGPAARYTVIVPAGAAGTVDVSVGQPPAAPTAATDDDYTYDAVPGGNVTAPTAAQCGATFQFDVQQLSAPPAEVFAAGVKHPATPVDGDTRSFATPNPAYAPGITYTVTGVGADGSLGADVGTLRDGCFKALPSITTPKVGITRVSGGYLGRTFVTGGDSVRVEVHGIGGSSLSGAKLLFDGVPGTNNVSSQNSAVCLDFEGNPCVPSVGPGWLVGADTPPHAAGNAELSVLAADGTIYYGQTDATNDLQFDELPRLRYLTPPSGPVSGGNQLSLEIENAHFGLPVLTIGGQEATDRTRLPGTAYDGNWAKSRFTFTVPAGIAPGPAEVRITPTLESEFDFTSTYTYEPDPTPTVTPTPQPTRIPEPECPVPSAGCPPLGPSCDGNLVNRYRYALAGSATLKTLTKGAAPLAGTVELRCGTSGGFTGDLTLAPSTAKLTALGFLPVTAQLDLVPTERVTGTLAGGRLSAVAKVRIKLPSVKTFGIELAGGANCQAKQISSIALTSTQPTFAPLAGGPVAGTFAISDLSGCGFLTGIVSPLTKGNGNAVALNLSPVV